MDPVSFTFSRWYSAQRADWIPSDHRTSLGPNLIGQQFVVGGGVDAPSELVDARLVEEALS